MTPPIEAAREKRARLHQAMVRLEEAASVPAGSTTWTGELRARLGAVVAALEAHISEVESPDGIIAGIVETAPRLAPLADALRDDHPRLRRQTEEVADRLASADPVPGPDGVREIRDAVLGLLGELSRHRQRGADLVYEAYNVDIGGPA